MTPCPRPIQRSEGTKSTHPAPSCACSLVLILSPFPLPVLEPRSLTPPTAWLQGEGNCQAHIDQELPSREVRQRQLQASGGNGKHWVSWGPSGGCWASPEGQGPSPLGQTPLQGRCLWGVTARHSLDSILEQDRRMFPALVLGARGLSHQELPSWTGATLMLGGGEGILPLHATLPCSHSWPPHSVHPQDHSPCSQAVLRPHQGRTPAQPAWS